jgi:hypothetical protein
VGAEMHGGQIRVLGNAGHLVGAVYRGGRRGMTGGEILIAGIFPRIIAQGFPRTRGVFSVRIPPLSRRLSRDGQGRNLISRRGFVR